MNSGAVVIPCSVKFVHLVLHSDKDVIMSNISCMPLFSPLIFVGHLTMVIDWIPTTQLNTIPGSVKTCS